MRVEMGMGKLGPSGSAWGLSAEGCVIFLLTSPQATVRVTFDTEAEAQEHGCAAIYLAKDCALRKGKGNAASPLVGPDGGPLS